MKKPLIGLVVLLTAIFSQPGVQALPYSQLYIIGDSLSDQGNLFAATQDLFPLGLAPIPAADHYFQGRFSNGENYADLLVARLGLSSSRSSAGGNNFAYGGARTTYNSIEASAPINSGGILATGARPWSIDLQRQAFVDRGIHDPAGLYIVWTGANDLADALSIALSGDLPLAAQFLNTAVSGIQNVIAAYLATGAGTVLIPNIPDLGLVPDILELDLVFPGVAAAATDLTLQFNSAVGAMLDGVRALAPGVKLIHYDSFTYLRAVVANPGAYGFSNASAACYSGFFAPAGPGDTVCNNPDEYLFWDGEHPSTAFHRLIAQEFFAAIPEPVSVWLLLLGMLGLGAARIHPPSRRPRLRASAAG